MVETFKNKDSVELKKEINNWERDNIGSIHVNNISFVSHDEVIYGFVWYDQIEHN